MSTPYPSITLLDGHTIPQLAFGTGTGLAPFGADVSAPIVGVIHANYLHIDTAQAYRNEDSVGRGLAQSNVPRDTLFVTTKLHTLAEGETVLDSMKKSLKTLGLEYVNLWLVHSPIPFEAAGKLEEVWKGMEECKQAGLARSIGVSNFRPVDLERVLKVAKIKPVVNQIEFHPYVQAQLAPLLALQKQNGVITEAYGGMAPLTRVPDGPVTAVLQSIAKKLGEGATETQILLKWTQAKGTVAITTTKRQERLEEYLGAYKLPALSEEDINAIDEAGAKQHYRRFMNHMNEF